MKSTGPRFTNCHAAVIATIVACVVVGSRETTPAAEHLNSAHRGGFPGMPTMNGIERTTNGVKVSWDGPSGYYQLYQKLGLSTGTWQKFGAPNLSRSTNISAFHANAFFKVAGPQPRYAGSQACMECHENIHNVEANTRHAKALDTLKLVNQDKNPSCLPCHTVGYGLPTGFTTQFATPHLAGVQCESCHGPGGNHAANEMDVTVRPRIELAGQVCGGCHNEESHRPVFEQWKSSGHFSVVEDMNPSGRINACGRCHSGSSRLALIKGENPSITVSNDANVGITCAVCHDPHANHKWTNSLSGVFAFTNALTGRFVYLTNTQVGGVYTNQLRHPLNSTNDYSLATGDDFSTKYNPNINVCAQCHNHRGAAWTTTSRPPHHSPQYNMLLGTVGELESGVPPRFPSTHSKLEKQCVTCHMPAEGDGSEAHPIFSAHTFKVEAFDSCRSCHSSPELFAAFAMAGTAFQIQELKGYLDFWAMTKAPAALQTKYGSKAWEYTAAGELSGGGAGPTSSEQSQIPDGIKKARFNLYLVNNDGSFGIHNGPLAVSLLEAGANWVAVELNK